MKFIRKNSMLRVLAVIIMLGLLGACSARTLKSGELSSVFTQTKVILSDLPTGEDKYSEYFSLARPVFYVPGLYERFIPQGICYSAAKELVIISGYFDEEESVSRLTCVDNLTGEVVNTVGLLNADGTGFFGHVGGLACSQSTVYITNGGKAYYISLASLCSAQDGTDIKIEGSFTLNTKGSFATCIDGVLWTGDFIESEDSERKAAEHITTLPTGETLYAMCEGYKLSGGLPDEKRAGSKPDTYIPDCVLAVPEQIQGMTRLTTGEFVFSTSYGRKNDSAILVYNNILDTKSEDSVTIDGKSVPLYALGSSNLKQSICALPMAEGVARVGDNILLLFESGADKYRNGGGKHPTDYVFELDFS